MERMICVFVTVFVLCLNLANSSPISIVDESSVKCGISPALDRYQGILNGGDKIMGGVLSPPHFWPWVAALMYPKDESEKPMEQCTGEIIGSRWIITAGHCIEIAEDGFFNVGTNNDKIITNETRYDVKKIYSPPDGSDIILVELTRKLKYGQDILPICISKSVVPKIGEEVVVAGFGTLFIEYDPNERTGVDKEETNWLHEGIITIKDNSECENRLNRTEKGTICAGGVNRGVMEGDSGGPIMGVANNKFYLFGAVSEGEAKRIGNDNLTVDELDTYSIISIHCDWIEKTTKGDVKCEK